MEDINMSSIKFNTAKDWFEKLKDLLVKSFEDIDTDNFIITEFNLINKISFFYIF